MNRAFAFVLIVAMMSLPACRKDCDVSIGDGPWTYYSERHFRRGKLVCTFVLSYDGNPLLGNALTVTPIGTFEVMMQSEHGDSNSGWKRISVATSTDVRVSGSPLTEREIAAGYYREDRLVKRPATPPDWVYMGDVVDPGWVHPMRLTDVNFLVQHPANR